MGPRRSVQFTQSKIYVYQYIFFLMYAGKRSRNEMRRRRPNPKVTTVRYFVVGALAVDRGRRST
jgi:hypothetical protein